MTKDRKRYTIDSNIGKEKIVAHSKAIAYKKAVSKLTGSKALKNVPDELNLEVTKVEVQKLKWEEA